MIEPDGRLAQLERAARALEIDAASRAAALERVAAHAEAYLARLERGAVLGAAGADDGWRGGLEFDEQPSPIDDCLELLGRHVEPSGLHIGSGRFFAYIPSGGLYYSALGDFLAAVNNRYTGVGSAAPGAARLEGRLIEWLAGVFGYPEGADGDLTSGGSVSNLSAAVVAREAAGISSREVERTVVYLTAQSHHTFVKALRIAGLSECVVRRVPMDSGYRMQAEALEHSIRADRAAGLNPWLVLATAGTTDTGAVDPLPAIADIAAAERVWMHVDAAYGGAFMLCPEGRERLAGIERSDSLIFNPHKGLFLPGGSSVVLVRDRDHLRQAFRLRGAYMQDDKEQERSACDRSPELTRPFRGLRLWLPLKLFGLAPFRAALAEKLELAHHFHARLSREPGFEVGAPPDLSVVTFRYRPERGDADEFNRRLNEAIRADGQILLSSTTLDGRFVLRLAVLGYNTHFEEVELALEVIRELAARLADR